MPDDLSHITRCLELREAAITGAVLSRDGTRGLLAHLAAVSAPDTGVAKVLLVLARMATTACDWIDGDLTIDLTARGEAETAVETATDLGGGMRERLLPLLVFKAPLAEFARAIERVPHLIAPLTLQRRGGRRLSLSATASIRRTSIPPPPIEVAPESLIVRAPPLPAPKAAVPEDESFLPLPVIASGSSATKAPAAPAPSSPPSAAPSDPPLTNVDAGWDE